jgi:hypothetical protein
VKEKFNTKKDKEGKATLEDIEALESDFRTQSFQQFLRQVCKGYNAAEQNRAFGEYEDDKLQVAEELESYVSAIAELIDVIDEHAHHLKGL